MKLELNNKNKGKKNFKEELHFKMCEKIHFLQTVELTNEGTKLMLVF